eukprot:12642691-Alexandrium_andersonii.AAC.1
MAAATSAACAEVQSGTGSQHSAALRQPCPCRSQTTTPAPPRPSECFVGPPPSNRRYHCGRRGSPGTGRSVASATTRAPVCPSAKRERLKQ